MSELYQLPDGWEWKKLGNFGKFIRGVSYKKEQLLDRAEDDSYTLLRANNIQNQLDLTEVQIVPKYVAIGKEIQDGDILFAMSSGSKHLVGKNILLFGLENYTFGAFCSVYRIEKKSLLISNYLSYLFTSSLYRDRLSALSMGANINNLKSSDLEVMDIPVPLFEEQKRIVQKLDALFERIDKAIAILQKNINTANNLMNIVLNDVFSDLDGQYPKKTLFSFDAAISAGGTPLRQNKLFWENGTIEWFSSGELNQLFTKPANEKITQFGLENSSAKLFESGTLLIGMYDTAAMKMSILSNSGSCNQAIVGFKPDRKELDIFFAKYQLEYLKPKILEQRQGVRQKNLNLTKIKNTEIIFPNIDKQKEIVLYLNHVSVQIEQVKSAQQQKMQSLLDLKSSILDRAFHGKL